MQSKLYFLTWVRPVLFNPGLVWTAYKIQNYFSLVWWNTSYSATLKTYFSWHPLQKLIYIFLGPKYQHFIFFHFPLSYHIIIVHGWSSLKEKIESLRMMNKEWENMFTTVINDVKILQPQPLFIITFIDTLPILQLGKLSS